MLSCVKNIRDSSEHDNYMFKNVSITLDHFVPQIYIIIANDIRYLR